ncbi:ABC transporter ATP-binding protein [Paeniglutamicibacter sulfureus]|uniref:ABC transporter ATP-binding protein n=1 Tax=Paeniglutamicibacter sulfureus TaxID=43666 RepID=UPI002665D4C6|nr:ABC transporter ATP-binding protein [Paeniglutamicibacter sulfureus]MDO2934659.1 ABC transporter ATP-binding protein [Paeniglutamicibacter sulfureus]
MAERLIEATGVSKHYGGVRAVDGVDFHVNNGELLGLVGANGAGKSTLFNLIAGSTQPTTGKIVAFGEDVTKARDFEMCRRGVARTFQVVRPLQGMTAIENAMVGAFSQTSSTAAAHEIAADACRTVGLGDKMQVVAQDLTLSGQKRMEVARALATGPKVLLLDEMMAGLNPEELDGFLDTLRDINRSGTTLIVVEHVMKAVTELAQRIVVMNQGKKIAEGTADEVFNDQAVIQSYLGETYAAS